MDIVSKALSYLEQDPVLNIDMLESLRHNEADVLVADNKGVLLGHHYRGLLLLSVSDKQTAESIISTVDQADVIVGRPECCLDSSKDLLGLDYSVPCIQHAYLNKNPLPIPPVTAKVMPLTPADLQFISDNYSLQLDREYILERLRSGAIYGIYYQKKLAGFAGFHAEGALGMLEIVPPYRRLGLGYYLQVYMTNLALERGKIPYNQVKTENQISIRLQEKGGYTAAKQPLYWIMRSRV